MKILAQIIGKLVAFVGEKLGKGSSMPGRIALKIDKNLLSKYTMPDLVIAVTGSSGKTSTSYMIAKILKEAGYTVAHNVEGANLKYGITTLMLKNTTLRGNFKKDACVIEVDERYTEQVFEDIKPTHLVVCNITRDQPPRHGNYEKVYNVIKNAIKKCNKLNLILNGDDPLMQKLAQEIDGGKRKIKYFGVGKCVESLESPLNTVLDNIYCPKCYSKLQYEYVSFLNVGKYNCPTCDFTHPQINYLAKEIDNTRLSIEDNIITPFNNIVYTYYNIAAAYAVAKILEINSDVICKTIEDMNLVHKRAQTIECGNKQYYILTGKNENAPSYNQAILHTMKDTDKKIIAFGYDYISLRYPFEDMSWMYDIDFEFLFKSEVESFVCVGPFAKNIATRIKLAGFEENKIICIKNISELPTAIQNMNSSKVYAILNMGVDDTLKNTLDYINTRK